MKTGKIQITLWILGLGGAALFTLLLVHAKAGEVGKAIATAGWGIVAVALFHLIPLLLDALAWRVLFPPANRLTISSLFWMRWIGESVTNLVPSAAVGGDVVRARLAAVFGGAPLPICAASVIVDITIGVFSQIGFTLLGLVLLVVATGRTSFIGPTLLGAMIAVLAAAGFYFVQRLGLFRAIGLMISKLANSPDWHSLVQSGETLDEAVRALYARRGALLANFSWTVISLVVSSGEIWIALYAVGIHASFTKAIILQSMAFTIRSGFFLVPAALGVQEGGYLVIGNLLGIRGDMDFAVSLITRIRDLLVGVPALITWQVIESRRLWRRRAR